MIPRRSKKIENLEINELLKIVVSRDAESDQCLMIARLAGQNNWYETQS